ncbi:hypothetical protein E4T56_gene2966 [Termitomyces sp. T112]|nr:hypothetical protein E4T56_gene2966 [Termitomyces sp. T112]
MQVDNPLQHPSFSFHASLPDISDIFNADAFADDFGNSTLSTANNINSPATASSSRGSSPYLASIQTPPQLAPPHAFPEYNPSSIFGFDDDLQTKQLDSVMNIPNAYDLFSSFQGADMGIDDGLGMEMTTDMPDISTGIVGEVMGIDPQLVGTPSALSDIGEENEELQQVEDEEHDGDVSASPSSSGSPRAMTTTASKLRSAKRKEKEVETDEEREKLTLVIQPVKAGGHGKARKGTVQSGGIVKKTPTSNPVTASLGKENTYTLTTASSFVTPPAYTPPSAFQPTNMYNLQSQDKKKNEKDDEDDDLPQDWRPSPEVLAKMTSKEKRQLRNKISARNFRVRRKEYISTLEGDIAERDRLLEAIRSELGSTQSENLALRQEIAALKRTLLEGRVPTTAADGTTEYPLLNLPPPAPLPAQSAAATLQAQAQAQAQQQSQSSPLLTPNTQKDTTKNGRFWGGVRLGMGMGGVTPVHRVVLPEMSVADLLASQFGPSPFVAKDDKWKENVNPLLNGFVGEESKSEKEKEKEKEREKMQPPMSFEGFSDVNPFTMKTLDAYRMHLWGKMAAQQQYTQHQHHLLHQQQHLLQQQAHANQQLGNLASLLRPAFFTSPGTATSPLTSLLSGKHIQNSPAPPYSPPPPPYSSPPTSPLLVGKGSVVEKLERERREREREREMQRGRERERKETAMYAAIASQTLLSKLGNAFWDAFAGSPSTSACSSGSGSGSGLRPWDADKVRKVLEGKAVVRVVDVEEVKPQQTQEQERKCFKAAEELLEQSMRSLTLNKKS